jgi:hypothetical protein
MSGLLLWPFVCGGGKAGVLCVPVQRIKLFTNQPARMRCKLVVVGVLSSKARRGLCQVMGVHCYCRTQWAVLFKWNFIMILLVALSFLVHDKENN